MSDTFITVIAIMLAAVLIFVIPLVATSNRIDDIAQTDVETLTSNFVEEIRATGKLTQEKYLKYKEDLTATGNIYDINLEFKILDENPEIKRVQSEKDKIGENVYYTQYTTQIEEVLENTDKKNTFELKNGDIVSIVVRNTNLTVAQQLKNFFYTVAGNDTYTIVGSKSALVTISGSSETIVADANDKNQGNDTSEKEDNKNKLLYNLYEVDENGENKRKLEVSEWTNKNVLVEMNSKDEYKLNLLYYWKYQEEKEYKCCEENKCKIESKSNINVYWKNEALEKYSSIENISINIDRDKPEIGNIQGSDKKGNNATIEVTKNKDLGGSGIKSYYCVWTDKGYVPTEKPTKENTNWTRITSNTGDFSIDADWTKNGKTCYVWIIDNAGNISEPKSADVTNLVKPVEDRDIIVNDTYVEKGKVINAPITINGDYKYISFNSKIPTIANFVQIGVLKGISTGIATIECKITNYNGTEIVKTCKVTVIAVEFLTNGGNYVLESTTETSPKIRLETELSISGLELNFFQYMWNKTKIDNFSTIENSANWRSLSENLDSVWSRQENGAYKTKGPINTYVTSSGSYYLCVKMKDENGKIFYAQSQSFKVLNNSITINYNNNRKKYEKVSVTVTYPSNSTRRKFGVGSTLSEAMNFVYDSTTQKQIIDVNENKYVYAKAIDSNGKEIASVLKVTNIDKTLKGNIKVGDYVKYMYKPDRSSDKIDLLTKVLYKEKYGHIQLISADAVNPYKLDANVNNNNYKYGINISGNPSSYNGAISILNNFANLYINDTIAQSARSVGANTYQNNYENTTKIGEYKGYDYNYQEDYTAISNNSKLKADNNEAYWLASRTNEITAGSNPREPENEEFYFRRINEDGSLQNVLLFQRKYSSYINEEYEFLRPCITLIDGLLVTGGNGTKENPYIINKY